jgi:putative oxidoreductase
MTNLLKRITSTYAPAPVLIIRLMVGAVFVLEGTRKFLVPEDAGSGRFRDIGLPAPDFLGPFVGFFELACGLLILAGLLTRLAAIPLMIVMAVAIITTKIPTLGEEGFVQMAHDARLDYSMFLGSLFLLLVGAGPHSVDAKIAASPPR